MKGWVSDNWFYGFVIDGARSPKLMDASVEFKFGAGLRLKAGQFKHGFGRETFESASTWRFVAPSRVVEELGENHVCGGSSYRDQGIMMYGVLKGAELVVDYSVFVMNGNGINATDVGNGKDVVAHVGVGLPVGVAAGGTFYTGNRDSALSQSGLGFDACFANDKIWVMGEYLAATLEQERGVGDLGKAGWQLGATYKLTDAIEVGCRYDAWDPNTDQRGDAHQRMTVGAGYWLTTANRITLNLHLARGEAGDAGVDSSMIIQLQGSLG